MLIFRAWVTCGLCGSGQTVLNGQKLARIRLWFTRNMPNRASFCTANSTAICNHGLHNFQGLFKDFSRTNYIFFYKNYLINQHSCTKMFLRYPWVLQVLSHRGWAKFSSAKWSNFTEKCLVYFKEFSRTKEIKYFLTPGGGGGVLPYKWGCTAGWGRIFTIGLTISTDLLQWGCKLSGFLG